MASLLTSPQIQLESVFELPGKSARVVQKHWKLFAFVNTPALILAVLSIFGKDTSTNKSVENINAANPGEVTALIGLTLAGAIAFILISLFFYTMAIRLSLETINNRRITARALINVAVKYWLRLLAVTLLMGIIIIAGLILLIVPGIIAAILLTFAPIILIDKDTGVIDALKGSYRMVTANLGTVLVTVLMVVAFVIVAALVNKIPYIGPLLGAVISILFSLILFFRYNELKNSVEITYSRNI